MCPGFKFSRLPRADPGRINKLMGQCVSAFFVFKSLFRSYGSAAAGGGGGVSEARVKFFFVMLLLRVYDILIPAGVSNPCSFRGTPTIYIPG